MRHVVNGKRNRGRQGRSKPSNQRNQSYDSSGPDGKVRGTANQVFEKYQGLARDAHTAGDRVSAENYSQHAEHYFRIINTMAQNDRNRQQANGSPEAGAVSGRGNGGGRGQPDPSHRGGARNKPEAVIDQPEVKTAAPHKAETEPPRGNGDASGDAAPEAAKT